MQMNCMNCDHQLICRNADDDKNHVCSMYDPIFHKTNADRIRAMSDEELAKEKAASVNCHLCLLRKTCKDDDMESCYKLWLEWLQRDAQS